MSIPTTRPSGTIFASRRESHPAPQPTSRTLSVDLSRIFSSTGSVMGRCSCSIPSRGEGMEQEHLPITLPVLEKMRLRSTDNVLDVGCGAGWLSRRLAKMVPEGRVVGMDISDEMIRHARRSSVDFHNLLFVAGEVAQIPWQPNFFSHVISVESSYYWPDPAAGLKDISRVLSERGSAWILINYYRDNPHCHQWGSLLAVPTQLLS